MSERSPEAEEAALMKADLYRIAKALDIPALPYSGHEAVERDFLPRIAALKRERDEARADLHLLKRAVSLMAKLRREAIDE